MNAPTIAITRKLLLVFALLPSLIGWAQTGAVRARVAGPVDVNNRVILRGNVHPLARPEFDRGMAPDELPMRRILLVLQRSAEQEAALRQLLEDQQVKSSPRFHQWLTPQQIGQRFGPADADLEAIIDWLTGQGFAVNHVSDGRTVVEFSGTAGLVRQALGAEIHCYRVNGEDHWANAGDPQIPAALAPVVAGFASLNNFPRQAMSRSLGTFRRSKLTGEVQPLFTYPVTCAGGSNSCYYFALGPADFATIYNVLPLWKSNITGAGVTIAVVGETNINPQDVADFRSMFALTPNAPNVILNGPDPGINGEEVEADLDVEWAGAVATGATIDLVVSETTEVSPGVDLSALYIVDNNIAPIMSESYGTCEAALGSGGNSFHSTLWEQAAAQGITVLMAAGDSGPAGCDSANEGEVYALYGLAVSGMASTPFNVAVGGTDFNDQSNPFTYFSKTNATPAQSSALSYIPESSWNDSCAASGLLTGCNPLPSFSNYSEGLYLVAGSGGPSNCINPTGVFPDVSCDGGYAKPSWQSGTGVPPDGARDIPDVSMFAGNGLNNSFYVMCQMDANGRDFKGSYSSCDLNSPFTDFQGGAGTSAAAQVFAGIMALVNQKYGRQGNANYVLYPMAANSNASCVSNGAAAANSGCIFFDITVGNNSVLCAPQSLGCSVTGSDADVWGIMVSGGAPAYPTTAG
jgi:subtilase family serine protease